jgi:hypothetical protein
MDTNRHKCEVAKCCGKHYQRFKADGGMLNCAMCGGLLEYRPGPGHTKPRWTVEHLPQAEKRVRIDLGLDLLARQCRLGVSLSYEQIAAWCGCSSSRIQQIEKKALRKIRNKAAVMRVLQESL